MQFNFDAEFPEQVKRKTDKELIDIYSQSKVKDIDGREFYVYDDSTRKLGKLMMLIGIIAIIILAARLEYFSD